MRLNETSSKIHVGKILSNALPVEKEGLDLNLRHEILVSAGMLILKT
jgi:hypothetical protein